MLYVTCFAFTSHCWRHKRCIICHLNLRVNCVYNFWHQLYFCVFCLALLKFCSFFAAIVLAINVNSVFALQLYFFLSCMFACEWRPLFIVCLQSTDLGQSNEPPVVRSLGDDGALSSSTGNPTSLDTLFGPEMEDLQQLLVTMASGKGIELGASRKN